MPLSDKDQAEFEDLMGRAGLAAARFPGEKRTRTRRGTRVGVVGMLAGLVLMIVTFTWSIPLGLAGIAVMGVSIWGLVVTRPKPIDTTTKTSQDHHA